MFYLHFMYIGGEHYGPAQYNSIDNTNINNINHYYQ